MKSTRIALAAALAAASALTAAAPATTTADAMAASCRLDVVYTRQAQIDSRVTVNAEDDVVAEVTCADAELTNFRMSGRFYQTHDGSTVSSQSFSQYAVSGVATAEFTDHHEFTANDNDLKKASQYCVQLYSPQSRTVCESPVVIGDLSLLSD